MYLLQHNFLFIMAELLHLRISPNLLTRICGLELNCIRYSIISDLSWKHCCTPANISIGILGWTDETTILLVDDIPVIVVQSWVSSISNTSSGHRACQDGGSASSLRPCPLHLVSFTLTCKSSRREPEVTCQYALRTLLPIFYFIKFDEAFRIVLSNL